MKPISEQLRAAVRNAPDTRYRIAQATGISEATLCKFIQGQRGLSLPSIDLLCEHLGLELVLKRRK